MSQSKPAAIPVPADVTWPGATPPAVLPTAPPHVTQTVPVAAVPKAIVFLDFDNTLIDGDAGPLFGRYLFDWRRHQLKPWPRFRLWLHYVPYILSMGVQTALYKLHARRRSSIIRAAYKGLRGVPAASFYGMVEEFARSEIAPRMFPEILAEMRAHLDAGRPCVVVTTGIESLIRAALDAVEPRMSLIGCRLQERNGKLTGRVVGPLFGVDKANILDAYARALGVPTTQCWAYSDHFSDKHMLEAVGHPITVNPRGQLRRLARRIGWEVREPARVPQIPR